MGMAPTYVSYEPQPMGNKSSMGHGSYSDLTPMGHGLYDASYNIRMAMTHGEKVADTGGEDTWKQVGTCQEHSRARNTVPNM